MQCTYTPTYTHTLTHLHPPPQHTSIPLLQQQQQQQQAARMLEAGDHPTEDGSSTTPTAMLYVEGLVQPPAFKDDDAFNKVCVMWCVCYVDVLLDNVYRGVWLYTCTCGTLAWVMAHTHIHTPHTSMIPPTHVPIYNTLPTHICSYSTHIPSPPTHAHPHPHHTRRWWSR